MKALTLQSARLLSIGNSWVFHSLWGSLFIALCSLIWIPTMPVPITGQTFALFMLALCLNPKACFMAALLYLLEASLGLPVLCGYSNPLWIIGPKAGYLLAFPFATFLIATLKKTFSSPMGQIFSIFMGQIVIYTLGFLWLAQFIGFQQAFIGGVLFFIPTAIIKNLFAVGIYQLSK